MGPMYTETHTLSLSLYIYIYIYISLNETCFTPAYFLSDPFKSSDESADIWMEYILKGALFFQSTFGLCVESSSRE